MVGIGFEKTYTFPLILHVIIGLVAHIDWILNENLNDSLMRKSKRERRNNFIFNKRYYIQIFTNDMAILTNRYIRFL